MGKSQKGNYYPLMVNLNGKRCIIIGGGQVAERKAGSLLEAGAAITIVSPDFSPQIEQWELSKTVRVLRHSYRSGLKEMLESLLVFAASNSREVNEAVVREAEALGKLVTIADSASGSGFIVPAVVRRGKLTIAVSTGGASPAAAKKIRQELERAFGGEYEIYLDLLQELRLLVQSVVEDALERQAIFRSMLEWDLIEWIRSGQMDTAAKERLIAAVVADPTDAGMVRLGALIKSYII